MQTFNCFQTDIGLVVIPESEEDEETCFWISGQSVDKAFITKNKAARKDVLASSVLLGCYKREYFPMFHESSNARAKNQTKARQPKPYECKPCDWQFKSGTSKRFSELKWDI